MFDLGRAAEPYLHLLLSRPKSCLIWWALAGQPSCKAGDGEDKSQSSSSIKLEVSRFTIKSGPKPPHPRRRMKQVQCAISRFYQDAVHILNILRCSLGFLAIASRNAC